MIYARFDGNLLPFAINATGGERTVFGNDSTQSDTLDANININFLKGWENGLDINGYPPSQFFNATTYTSMAVSAYLYQRGIAEFHLSQEFVKNSFTVEDADLYQSQSGDSGSPNVGNLPSTDNGENWKKPFIKTDNENQTKTGNLVIGLSDVPTSISYVGSTVTVTYTGGHGRKNGDITHITGITSSVVADEIYVNGTFAITYISDTQFSYTAIGTPTGVLNSSSANFRNGSLDVSSYISSFGKVLSPQSGFKNLVINGRRLPINQRGYVGTADWKHIIDGELVLKSGVYSASWEGNATCSIYKASSLGATDATTSWTLLASNATTDTQVEILSGEYVKLEFSSNDFDFVQFEFGKKATTYEESLTYSKRGYLYYYETSYSSGIAPGTISDPNSVVMTSVATDLFYYSTIEFKNKKRSIPSMTGYNPATGQAGTLYNLTLLATQGNSGFVRTGDSSTTVVCTTAMNINEVFTTHWVANSELLNETYGHDHWFI